MSGVSAQHVNDHFQQILKQHGNTDEFLNLVENEILQFPMYKEKLSNDNLAVLAAHNLAPQQLNKLIIFKNFSSSNKKFYKNILARKLLPSFSALDQSIQFGLIDNAEDGELKKILDSMLEVKAEVIDRILAKTSKDTVVNLIFEKLNNNPNLELNNYSFHKLLVSAKDDKNKLWQIYRLQANNKKLSQSEKAKIVNDIFGKLVDNRATTTEERLTILRALAERNTHLAQEQKENIVKKLEKRLDINQTTVIDRISIAKYTKDSSILIKLADKLEDSNNPHNIELAEAIITNTACPLNQKVAEKILNKPNLVGALENEKLDKLAGFAHTAAEFIHILNAPKVAPAVIDKIINRTPDKQAKGLPSLVDRNPKVCSIEDIAKSIIQLHKNPDHPFQLNQLSADNINRLMGVTSLLDKEAQELLRAEFHKKASPPPAKPKAPMRPDPARPEKPVAASATDDKKVPVAATPKTPKDLKTEWIKEQGYQKEVRAKEDGFDFLATKDESKKVEVFIACLEKIAKDSSQKDDDGNLTIYADDFDKETAKDILTHLIEKGPSIPGVKLEFNNIPPGDDLAEMIKEYNTGNQAPQGPAGTLSERLKRVASETASSIGSNYSDPRSEQQEYNYDIDDTSIPGEMRFLNYHTRDYLFSIDPIHGFPFFHEGKAPTIENITEDQIEGCFTHLMQWAAAKSSNHTVSLNLLQSTCGAAMADGVKQLAQTLKEAGILQHDFLIDDRSPAPAGPDRPGSGSSRRSSSPGH